MKLQIDFDNKIVRVEDSVTIEEFFEKLQRVIPSEEWKEYKLEIGIIEIWSNPVIINPSIPYTPQPDFPRPWENPFYYSTSTGICNYEIE